MATLCLRDEEEIRDMEPMEYPEWFVMASAVCVPPVLGLYARTVMASFHKGAENSVLLL